MTLYKTALSLVAEGKLREVDALVAEHVMGAPLPTSIAWTDYSDVAGKTFHLCPFYTTDISAAWDVVDKLRGVWDMGSQPKTWWAQLAVRVATSDKIVSAEASTIQVAIVLAALKSVENV